MMVPLSVVCMSASNFASFSLHSSESSAKLRHRSWIVVVIDEHSVPSIPLDHHRLPFSQSASRNPRTSQSRNAIRPCPGKVSKLTTSKMYIIFNSPSFCDIVLMISSTSLMRGISPAVTALYGFQNLPPQLPQILMHTRAIDIPLPPRMAFRAPALIAGRVTRSGIQNRFIGVREALIFTDQIDDVHPIPTCALFELEAHDIMDSDADIRGFPVQIWLVRSE